MLLDEETGLFGPPDTLRGRFLLVGGMIVVGVLVVSSGAVFLVGEGSGFGSLGVQPGLIGIGLLGLTSFLSLILYGSALWSWVGRPVQSLLEKNKQLREGDLRVIPKEQFPTGELRSLFEIQNNVIQTLSQIEHPQAIETLVKSVDAKDEYTHGHSIRVGHLAREVGVELGLSEEFCSKLEYTGTLHDLGKISLDEEIFSKPGPLSVEERRLIQQHPTKGKEFIQFLEPDREVIDGVLYHHERFDGEGYPEGLKGEEIPRVARILAVADAIDAMLSNRQFRERLTLDETREELKQKKKQQFDPEIAEAALNLLRPENQERLPSSVLLLSETPSLTFTEET